MFVWNIKMYVGQLGFENVDGLNRVRLLPSVARTTCRETDIRSEWVLPNDAYILIPLFFCIFLKIVAGFCVNYAFISSIVNN
jgi:hypothetical protein